MIWDFDLGSWTTIFAVLPHTTIDNKVVWLQRVLRRQVYTGYAIDCADCGAYSWEYKTID